MAKQRTDRTKHASKESGDFFSPIGSFLLYIRDVHIPRKQVKRLKLVVGYCRLKVSKCAEVSIGRTLVTASDGAKFRCGHGLCGVRRTSMSGSLDVRQREKRKSDE